jgi:toxin ParE1/3/4
VARIVWSPQALADVDAICAFIARDAPRHAESVAARIVRAAERLAQFPRSGRIVPELARDDFRETFVLSYRVIYRLRNGDVEIVTVHHGARLLNPESLS